jgi:histidinol-phosphate/aromatic aminotransferase/cobyric acid decarboxylase-like protein
MSHNASAGFTGSERRVELRTGTPYANLISNQVMFANALAEHFNVSPGDVIPAAGTTGAIEAVRNHVYRMNRKNKPTVLTVCPGYWRARESFLGFGFDVIDHRTEHFGFTINEIAFAEKAREEAPDLIYLSLPNNPTGALFDPDIIINGASEATAIMIDLTLPSHDVDVRSIMNTLYYRFKARQGLFLVGSTSKSHGTAEYRVGWAVCANSEDAEHIREENRNVVASISIRAAMSELGKAPTALTMIENSFLLLREGQREGRFEIVIPERMTETGYVLISHHLSSTELRNNFDRTGIRVMWGSEFGLGDQYIRLETLEPAHVRVFVDVINA